MYVAFTTVFVADQPRAKKFYIEKLGFEERIAMEIGDGLVWLSLGIPGEKTEVVLIGPGFPDWSTEKVGKRVHACLEVDDVFSAHQAWASKGVQFTEAPRMEFFGGWTVVEDIDGNQWGVHSPVRETSATA